MDAKPLWTWIPLATAVGVAQSILPLFGNNLSEIRIKWPNDVWITSARGSSETWGKAGGILCEALGSGSDSFVVVGIGLNCTTLPESLDLNAQSLSIALHSPIFADEIRMPVLNSVLRSLDTLSHVGSLAIHEAYLPFAALPEGKMVQWLARSGSEIRTGKVKGLGELGELLVRETGSEEVVGLYAEDVRLVGMGSLGEKLPLR